MGLSLLGKGVWRVDVGVGREHRNDEHPYDRNEQRRSVGDLERVVRKRRRPVIVRARARQCPADDEVRSLRPFARRAELSRPERAGAVLDVGGHNRRHRPARAAARASRAGLRERFAEERAHCCEPGHTGASAPTTPPVLGLHALTRRAYLPRPSARRSGDPDSPRQRHRHTVAAVPGGDGGSQALWTRTRPEFGAFAEVLLAGSNDPLVQRSGVIPASLAHRSVA